MKTNFSFIKYYEDEEKENGDYWQYLTITPEQEIELNLNFLHTEILKIISQIKNEELKDKMTKKLKELIKQSSKTIEYSDIQVINNLFTKEEQKELIENKIKNLNMEYSSLSTIISLIMDTKETQTEWQISQITNILEKIDDTNQIIRLIKIVEENSKIYYSVIKNLKNKLPIQFFKYLSIKENPNYIKEQVEKNKKNHPKIGIDSKISIGVEIEANQKYAFYDFLEGQKNIEFERANEATTDIEIKTTKELHDTEEDIAKLKTICETMTELGYYYNKETPNAAGQINLGIDYLDSAHAILTFYEIFGNCEELLWYISNESGQIARVNIYSNSRMKAISEIIGKRIIDEDISREEVIELFNDSHSYSAKIAGLKYKKNTVCLRGDNINDLRFEIRIPNGGCNSQVWIDNIRLYGKIMEISKKIADITKKEELTKEEESLLRLKIELQNKKLSLEEKLDILMNLLFKEEEIKEIYIERFNKTQEKIQETGTRNYIKTYEEPAFDEVEFLGQSGKNNDEIHLGKIAASYDPETDEYYSENRHKR